MVNIENIINDYIERAQLPFLSHSKRELLREVIREELLTAGVEFEPKELHPGDS